MNPIDILLNQEDLGALELKTKVYLVRPILGSIATQMIGIARSICDENRVTSGGVDDPVVSKLLEASAKLDGIWGYEPQMEKDELLGRLKALRIQIVESIDPTDESSDLLANAMLSLKPTLDYLSKGREFTINDRIATYCRGIDLDPALLVDFQNKRELQRAETFRAIIPDIIDYIDDTFPIDGEFEQLPAATQIRIFENIEKAVSAAKLSSAKSLFYGTADRSGDAAIFNSMLKTLNAWAAHQMRVDPEFAMRRAGL